MPNYLILDFDCTLSREHSGGFGFVIDANKKIVAFDGKANRPITLVDPKLLHLVFSAAARKGWNIRVATNHGASGRLISKVGSKAVMHNDGGPVSNGGQPGIQFLFDAYLPADRTYLKDPSHIIAHMAVNIVENKTSRDISNGKKTHFQAIVNGQITDSNADDDSNARIIFVDDETTNLDSVSHYPNIVTIIAPIQLESCHDECSHLIQIAVQIGMTAEDFAAELQNTDIEAATQVAYMDLMRKALQQDSSRRNPSSRSTTPWLLEAEGSDDEREPSPPLFSHRTISKPRCNHLIPIYMSRRKESAPKEIEPTVPEPVTPIASSTSQHTPKTPQLTTAFNIKKRVSDEINKADLEEPAADQTATSSSLTASGQLEADVKKMKLSQ